MTCIGAPESGPSNVTLRTTVVLVPAPLPVGVGANAPCPQRPLAKAVRRLDEPAQGDADALAEAVADAEADAVADAGFGRIRFAP